LSPAPRGTSAFENVHIDQARFWTGVGLRLVEAADNPNRADAPDRDGSEPPGTPLVSPAVELAGGGRKRVSRTTCAATPPDCRRSHPIPASCCVRLGPAALATEMRRALRVWRV